MARRASLEERLASRRTRQADEGERRNASRSGMQGMAEGLKLASEFAAGIIVGGALGYVLDLVAGTSPFGLIVLLMFGFVAGVRNVLRAVGPKRPAESPSSTRNDETGGDRPNS